MPAWVAFGQRWVVGERCFMQNKLTGVKEMQTDVCQECCTSNMLKARPLLRVRYYHRLYISRIKRGFFIFTSQSTEISLMITSQIENVYGTKTLNTPAGMNVALLYQGGNAAVTRLTLQDAFDSDTSPQFGCFSAFQSGRNSFSPRNGIS